MCHECREIQVKRVGFTPGLVAAAAVAVLWAGPVQAQESQGTTSQNAFSPSVSVMGSLGSNPERVPGESTRTEFFAATVELPFRTSSPRWAFAATYRPNYQYYREDDTLTSFDHAGSFSLRGALSPRTRLTIEGDAYVSNELRGIDAADVVLPRTRQMRGGLDAALVQQLSARDTLAFRGGYDRQAFPDGQLIDSDSMNASLGYGRALSPFVTATLSGRAQLARFDSGRQSRSTSVSAGGRFRIGRYTDLGVSGGLLWIQQDLGQGWQVVEQPGFTAAASLAHGIDRVALRIRAERDMGTTSGLGQATLRDRIAGSIGWGTNRWNLLGLAGFARNSTLDATNSPTPAVKTLTACGRGAVRVNRVLAVVGTLLYAHQLGELINSQPATDTFRVSLGIRIQANGRSMSAAGNQFRFDSIARDARATC